MHDVESVFTLLLSFMIKCTIWSLYLDWCCYLLPSARRGVCIYVESVFRLVVSFRT